MLRSMDAAKDVKGCGLSAARRIMPKASRMQLCPCLSCLATATCSKLHLFVQGDFNFPSPTKKRTRLCDLPLERHVVIGIVIVLTGACHSRCHCHSSVSCGTVFRNAEAWQEKQAVDVKQNRGGSQETRAQEHPENGW